MVQKKKFAGDALTVGQILKGLPATQLWGILVVAFGLISGAFTLGYVSPGVTMS